MVEAGKRSCNPKNATIFSSLNFLKFPLDKFLKWAYNILTKIKKGSPKNDRKYHELQI